MPTARRAEAGPARTHAALPLALAVSALVILRVLPPALASLLPPCPIHALTGLLCPGCGGTRALLALLHGNLALAWHHNPLVTAFLPVAIACLAATALRDPHRPWPRVRPALTTAALILATAFTVARNLPHPH